MNLQIQLLELFKIALENSKPFDDGFKMPYSCMTLTKNGFHLNCLEMPNGEMSISLSTPDYEEGKGFTLFSNKEFITGWIYIDGEHKFIKENDIWISQNIYLEQLYEQKPEKVKQSIQEYLQEISKLIKDVERTEKSKQYFTELMAHGYDKYGRPQTIEERYLEDSILNRY